jgi:hypothetical protein
LNVLEWVSVGGALERYLEESPSRCRAVLDKK